MDRRRKLRLLLLTALLVGIAAFALSTQWRFRAVALKARGELPTVSWLQILSLFADPGNQELRKAGRMGFVTLARQTGEGPCPALWSTPFGEIRGDLQDDPPLENQAREQLVDRVYHNSTVAVAPGDVVIDVGGHLGTFTRFSLDRGAGRVIVLEPEPRHAACLRLTFEEEIRRGDVVLIEAAAWRQAGVLHFRSDDATSKVDERGGLEVRAVTLDETVAELGLGRVDFIKMDIEGAELDALAGARQTLSRFGPKMSIAIYHEPGHRQRIPELVLAARPQYRRTATEKIAYFY